MMTADGIVKTIEEAGELSEVLGLLQMSIGRMVQTGSKKLAYWDEPHPDGRGDLRTRLMDEMADLMAALTFTADALELDVEYLDDRSIAKAEVFHAWHADPNNLKGVITPAQADEEHA